MAKLSSNRVAWQYVADDGTIYRVAAQLALTSQSKLGGAAAAITVAPKPASIKMRRITVHAVGVGSRVLPVYEAGAPICTIGETINANFQDNSVAFTSQGNPLPEGHKIHNVTGQST